MVNFDIHSLWAYSTIVSIQTQANGTLVATVQQNQGALFSPNQQVTIYPANPTTAPYFTFPNFANGMVCRVISIAGDQITMDYSVGNRERSNIRTVLIGDQIGNYITPKIFQDIEIALNANIQTTPPPPSSTPGNVSPPPSSSPGTPPAADPVIFTQGNNVFTSTSILADWNSDSPVTVGAETVTSLAAGAGGNPFSSGACLKFNINNSSVTQVGVNKDLSKLLCRDFKFALVVDAAATISGEETILHAWTDNYKANLIELRLFDRGGGKFGFLLRAPGTDNFASQVKQSNVQFTKGTKYDVELYMLDGAWCVFAQAQGAAKQLIIEWYNGVDASGYFAVNNQGLYIAGVSLGKFYSTQMSGIFYIQNVNFYQDYVAPTGPSTDAGKLADAWAGWKARYLRADGAVVRPYGDGINGIYTVWSDVVSEGPAYGLMLAVQMNDQVAFDLIETWIEANLERTHNGMTAASLMGWHWDDIGNAMYDWNFATDADIDRAVALIWAAHRKANGNAGWASSAINYGTKATAVITDLKTYAFRTDSGKNYMSSDAFQLSADPMEINVSYHSVGAMKIIQNYTSDVFWTNAIAGTYDLLAKMQAASMTDQGSPSAGGAGGVLMQGPLPCDWVGYSVSNHNVSQQPPNNRMIKYSYDAFRTVARIYWHYLWFADASALAYLTGALRSFFNGQWAALGLIYAEYYHNGQVAGAYEKSMMTFMAYLCGIASSSSDPTAAAIWTNKLASLYTKTYQGGFYKDNPSAGGAPSYFNNSWMMFHMLVKNGVFTNF